MATSKPPAKHQSRRWAYGFAAVAVVVAGLVWFPGDTIAGYARTGTAYGAKTACSCRHLAGRSLDSCESDFEPGMEAVFLSEDEEAGSVTAYVPLIASDTATWHEGFGCVLDPVER